jgi:Pyruvate/2-oxoacid:ferredoxin oxidoreductase gamma subunit
VERELLMTGIGGQGVQLAAQLLARAVLAEDRQVMLFGSYGGMMRGGNTDATLVVSDEAITSPPTVTDAWSAIVMHPDYWEPTRRRLRPDALVVVNTTLVSPDVWDGPTLPVPAGDIAVDLGNPGIATMVALGAYAASTGLVHLDTLIAALPETLPAYRARHVPANEEALRRGSALVPAA